MSPLDVTGRPNLILGCGYLGRRVAARWIAAGKRVTALTRRNADALTALGIEPIVGDVVDVASLRVLPSASTVLYAVGLDRTAGHSQREVYVNGLAHILDTLPPCERFIHVSSTGVYAQTDGRWVNEDSVLEPGGEPITSLRGIGRASPNEESGKVVREAERLLRSRRPDANILRYAGIYGPDRLLRRREQLFAGEPFTGDPERWLNLIHVADGAAAVLAAEARGTPGATYNIADDEPVTRLAFYAKLAELLGAPPPRFEAGPERNGNNRRISNAKAKAALAWQPRYPSYREGLVDAVGERPA